MSTNRKFFTEALELFYESVIKIDNFHSVGSSITAEVKIPDSDRKCQFFLYCTFKDDKVQFTHYSAEIIKNDDKMYYDICLYVNLETNTLQRYANGLDAYDAIRDIPLCSTEEEFFQASLVHDTKCFHYKDTQEIHAISAILQKKVLQEYGDRQDLNPW